MEDACTKDVPVIPYRNLEFTNLEPTHNHRFLIGHPLYPTGAVIPTRPYFLNGEAIVTLFESLASRIQEYGVYPNYNPDPAFETEGLAEVAILVLDRESH